MYFRESDGVTGFCQNTPLKMHWHLSQVLHGENGQNEYILIIFTFTDIVTNVSCIDL